MEKVHKKILFPLKEDWHGHGVESLWAEEIVDTKTYRIDNIPFFTNEVSYMDTVKGEEKDGGVYFAAVITRGRHSTYRIIIQKEDASETVRRLLAKLERMGVTAEKGEHGMYALDVAPEADVSAVYELLKEEEKKGLWEFAEGCFQHTTHNT